MFKFCKVLSVLLAASLLAACAGSHLPYPQLPRKDWLESGTRDVDREGKTFRPKVDLDKPLGLNDLVLLAIQQSPTISHSSINLDIQQIALTDARWKALPEFHLNYIISNNITRYNESKAKENKEAFKGYGETGYQLSFSGYFNNPVATYFDVQAQKELMSIAEATHKQVITTCIAQLAGLLIDIRAKESQIDSLSRSLQMAQKRTRFAATAERYNTNLWESSGIREDVARDYSLQLDTAKMELTSLRNQVKMLVGLDVERQLKLDTKSVEPLLATFESQTHQWEPSWEASTERYLLGQQVRLHQAGIMLAWAQYVPNISFAINENAPNGQSQPTNAQTDQFIHITFDFPILDWGRRYRGAEQSRARKRQSQLDEITRRQEYRQRWFNAEQQLVLEKSRLRQREHAVQSAERRLKAIRIAHEQGGAGFVELATAEQALNDAITARTFALASLQKASLAWMQMTPYLRQTFLETPQALGQTSVKSKKPGKTGRRGRS